MTNSIGSMQGSMLSGGMMIRPEDMPSGPSKNLPQTVPLSQIGTEAAVSAKSKSSMLPDIDPMIKLGTDGKAQINIYA